MSVLVPPAFSESVARLALGIEPIDAARGMRVPSGLQVALEGVPVPVATWRRMEPWEVVDDVLPRMARHASGHFVLLYRKGLRTSVSVRLFDRRRRFVPRRLRVWIPAESTVTTPVTDPMGSSTDAWRRIFRPWLYPGANYPHTERATGLRGRVVRGGAPMPWARVEARVVGTTDVVARAHGDDRGEFLLLIPPPGDPEQAWVRPDPMRLDIAVFGPAAPSGDAARNDPLSTIPQEVAIPPTFRSFDSVQAGTVVPATYRETVTGALEVALPLGVISSAGIAPFPFRFGP